MSNNVIETKIVKNIGNTVKAYIFSNSTEQEVINAVSKYRDFGSYGDTVFHRENGPALIQEDDSKFWFLNGKLHRVDGPAIEEANGDKIWYLNGKRHREDGPAWEEANGGKFWYFDGKHHRIDGPAIEWADGGKEWYFNGKYHRTDGPAIEWANGSKAWYVNGNKHRVDGPAYEGANGTKEWWVNGKRHRADGPAIERADGNKDWYFHDVKYRINDDWYYNEKECSKTQYFLLSRYEIEERINELDNDSVLTDMIQNLDFDNSNIWTNPQLLGVADYLEDVKGKSELSNRIRFLVSGYAKS